PHLDVGLRRGDDRERVDRGGDGEGELDERRGVPDGERRHHARPAAQPLGRGAGGDGEWRDLHGLPAHGERPAGAAAGHGDDREWRTAARALDSEREYQAPENLVTTGETRHGRRRDATFPVSRVPIPAIIRTYPQRPGT